MAVANSNKQRHTKQPVKKLDGKHTIGKPAISGTATAEEKDFFSDKKRVFLAYSSLINTAKEGRDPKALIASILKEVSDIHSFIQSHPGSRVIQACLKHGEDSQRIAILDKLSECLTSKDMPFNQYSMNVMMKLFTYNINIDTNEDKTHNSIIVPLITDRKRLFRLLYHRIGSKFIEYLYQHKDLPNSSKKRMVETIVKIPGGELLAESKRKEAKLELLKRAVDKELLELGLIHKVWKDVLDQYYVSNEESVTTELRALVQPEGWTRFLSSRDGVYVLMALISTASAKEKKSFIKELKSKFLDIATNSVDSVILLQLLRSIDDTVLSTKSILPELANFNELVYSQFGKSALLFILEGLEVKSSRYYTDSDRQLLARFPCTSSSKPNEIKSQELKVRLIPDLIEFAMKNSVEMSKDIHGKDLLIEVILYCAKDNMKNLTRIIENLADVPDIGTHTVTCLKVILNMETAPILIDAISMDVSTELLTSRWSFVFEHMLKSGLASKAFYDRIKTIVSSKIFKKKLEDESDSLKGAKYLVQAVKDCSSFAEYRPINNVEDEDAQLMDD
jgi:CPL (NUC119) domain